MVTSSSALRLCGRDRRRIPTAPRRSLRSDGVRLSSVSWLLSDIGKRGISNQMRSLGTCARSGQAAGRGRGQVVRSSADQVQYRMDEKAALQNACPVVKSQFRAKVHVCDPLVSTLSNKCEVGVPLAPRISAVPGFRIKTLPVVTFDAHDLIR